MNLYSLTDSDPDDPFATWAWNRAVWADSETIAVAWAYFHYDGEAPQGEDPGIRVIATKPESELLAPLRKCVHEERRPEILRLAGWRDENEIACDTCGLCAMGMVQYAVCDECYQCRECADGTCEACKP